MPGSANSENSYVKVSPIQSNLLEIICLVSFFPKLSICLGINFTISGNYINTKYFWWYCSVMLYLVVIFSMLFARILGGII